jgi:hypothetical protein
MLTGWNKNLLSQCSEASRSKLNKYISALIILILMWGVTGFCFAQRYIGLPTWGCALVSLFFITIVVMIERQIILTGGRAKSIFIFRGAIALVMALVGSTIVDQTMFGKDIDKQMANTIEEQVKELTEQRVRIVDEKLSTLHHEIDSIDNLNSQLQADINNNPFITTKSMSNTTERKVVNGKLIAVNIPTVTTTQVANPKQQVLDTNTKTVNNLRVQEQNWVEKKQTIEEDVRNECKASVGFLEELEAMWAIVSTRTMAGVFYLILFFLLMSLELFVVVSKMCEKECDYEIAIRESLKIHISKLERINKAIRA